MRTNAVIEAMETCRAMRYYKPDPVPDDLIETVLYAATRASSANNTQPWEFVVVRDAGQRARIAGAWERTRQAMGSMSLPDDPVSARTVRGVRNLLGTLAQVPVIVFVCVRNTYPAQKPDEAFMWSAAFAASQNLIVAARSFGLGALFSTLHRMGEAEIRETLGLPDDVHLATTIPLGWPERPFGALTRKPLAEVVHRDRW
jgi:nitroreductase